MTRVSQAALGPPVGDGGGSDVVTAAAFDAFARRERRPLVAFAWSLTGDFAAAEDLAQAALEAAWRAWDQVGAMDRPGAWARRVVINQASDRGRRAGREARALRRWAGRERAVVELEPEDDRFWAEVRKLPDRQCHAMALRYLENLSVAEIALVLGCAEGTVKSHLHRGRLALAAALGLLVEEDR
jgi:RNA polymerase sigma-70 factor (ECF subfamily)